jgi:beta-lactamase regulating signal transducer with metallopeptidase domain
MANAFVALESVGRLAWQASWHGAVLAALVLVAMRVRIVRRTLSPAWRSGFWLLVGVRLALPLAPALPTSIHNFYRAPFFQHAASPTPKTSDALMDGASNDAALKAPVRLAGAGPHETGKHLLNQPAAAPPTASAASPTSSTAGALAWRFALFGWLAGLVFVGMRYALGAWRLERIIGSCDAVRDERVLSLAEECRRECGLAARPALKRVPGSFGPTVAGFWRPTLLLSGATLGMDGPSLRFILLHEMRHIRTGDCRIGWMLRGLTAIHWFNPFCWLANRSWQAERELACDAWVLRHADANERRHYGQTLLEVLEHASLGQGAVFATGMASSPGLIERRIREMKQPTARAGRQHAAAVLVLSALMLVGFADRVRSQPSAATVAANHANPPAAKKPPATARPEKSVRKIFIVLARHVILVRDAVTQNADLSEFRIVTWDELLQLMRDASKTARIVPEIYGTNGSFKEFEPRSLKLTKLADELKAPTYLLSFVQPSGSERYDSISGPEDLKPDRSRLRAGTIRLANGKLAVGATVVLQPRPKYAALIYMNRADLRDRLDEIWIKTDERGRFHFYPKDDDFAVAALHPSGFGLATAAQLAKGDPITLAPWGQIDLKGNSETGLSATRTGEGKNPVPINLQTFSHTGHTVLMPAGRVWIQRLTDDKISGHTLAVVGVGETKVITIEPPTPAQKANPDKDAKTKPR